jgi:hypothetical protein
MTDGLNAKYWRVKAVKMRSLAERVPDLETKDSLLRMAVTFDRLSAEARRQERPGRMPGLLRDRERGPAAAG